MRQKMFVDGKPTPPQPHTAETKRKIGEANKAVRASAADKAKRAMPDPFKRFAKEAASFLKTQGWCVLVAGPCRVEAHPLRPFLFRFVMDFTGGKKKGKTS